MRTKQILICFFILISFQIFAINFLPVNYEFVFSEGSKFFHSFEKKYIDFYFTKQANTFFFSVIIGILNELTFDSISQLQIARLISLCSFIFLSLGIINSFKYFKIDKSLTALTIIFILVNPVIWTLSFRGTPDLISASLAFYASSIILIQYEKILKRRLAFLLLSIAITLKPFVGIFLIFIFFYLKRDKKIILNNKTFIDLVSLVIIPCIYFFTIKKYFGFYIMTDHYASKHIVGQSQNIKMYLTKFFGYACMLSIFLFPINLAARFKINFKIILAYSFLLFFGVTKFNFFSSKNKGFELDLGFFTTYMNQYILLILCFTLLFMTIISIAQKIDNKINYMNNFKIISTVLIFLLILAALKPAQRYLITILPIIIIFIIQNSDFKKIRILMIVGVFLYIPINLVSYLNMYNNSNINKEILEYIENKKLTKIIKLDTLKHSLGFIEVNSNHEIEKEYVLSNKFQDHFKKFEKSFLGQKKIYYIKKNN
jgi:hypothetical protein